MTLGDGIALSIRSTIAFMRKAWWLALVPVLPRFFYALAEMHGLVSSKYLAQFGLSHLAVSAVLEVMAMYWVIRFLALDQGILAALSMNRRSISTFAPYAVIFSVYWFFVNLTISAALEGRAIGVLIVVFLSICTIECLFAPWSVAAPSGSKLIGPIVSMRYGKKNLFWGVALLSVVQMPFGLVSNVLENIYHTGGRNIWIQSMALALDLIVDAIGLVAWCAVVFVIAWRSGVRINNTRGLEDIFA
jgi:hypothetical protein